MHEKFGACQLPIRSHLLRSRFQNWSSKVIDIATEHRSIGRCLIDSHRDKPDPCVE